MGDASFRLLPDFIGGAVIVRAPVGIVGILIGIEIFFGMFRCKFAHFANRPIRSFARVGVDNVRAIRMQDVLALDGDVLPHAQRHLETLRCADHGIGNPCISAGGIQQRFTRPKFSAATRFSHDVCGGAIFNRAAGIHPLGFPQDLNARQLTRQPIQT